MFATFPNQEFWKKQRPVKWKYFCTTQAKTNLPQKGVNHKQKNVNV